jgi:ribosomal protein L4
MLEAVTSTRGRQAERRRKVAEKNTSGSRPDPIRQTVLWTEATRPQGNEDPETAGLNRGRTIDYEPTIPEPAPTRS